MGPESAGDGSAVRYIQERNRTIRRSSWRLSRKCYGNIEGAVRTAWERRNSSDIPQIHETMTVSCFLVSKTIVGSTAAGLKADAGDHSRQLGHVRTSELMFQ